MYGAIIGDIVGSHYEFNNEKRKEFFPFFHPRSKFTDDTVLTVAMMDSLMNNYPYRDAMRLWFNMFPKAGYGGSFRKWAQSRNPAPYNSWGNGSAMRTSPIGWWFNTMEDVLKNAEEFAAVTHNHPEGIKGAKAIAGSIFLIRNGGSKYSVAGFCTGLGYDLSKTLDEIRPDYKFDVSCQGSVPVAIRAFLEGEDFEDVIRSAVSVGGDSDTIGAMAGSIAEAYYSIPESFITQAKSKLVEKIIYVADSFKETIDSRGKV